MERLIQAYLSKNLTFFDTLSQASSYYAQVFLKYASKVRDRNEIFEFMIFNKIGFYHAATFKEIADYYETQKNYEKVDQVYRIGLESLYKKGEQVNQKYFKEHNNLSH